MSLFPEEQAPDTDENDAADLKARLYTPKTVLCIQGFLS